MKIKVTLLILLMMNCLYLVKCHAKDIPAHTIADEYYFGDNTKMNWFEAKEYCESLGMGLLTPETEEENDKIFQEIKKKGTNEYFWTSGNDIEFEGKYVWNLTGRPFSFTKWAPQQPDNYPATAAGEDCIHLRYFDEKIGCQWNDISCDNKYYFICEKVNNPIEVLPSTTESNPNLSICTSSEESPEPGTDNANQSPKKPSGTICSCKCSRKEQNNSEYQLDLTDLSLEFD